MSVRARSREKRGSVDYPLLIAVAILIAFGLIAVWATSIPYGLVDSEGTSALSYVVAQLQWLAVGALAAFAAYKIGYRRLARLSLPLLIATTALLLYVALFGVEINGSRRWIRFGTYSIQPSEIAKLSMIIYLAYWLSSKGQKLTNKDTGLIPFMILVGSYVGLVLWQPDYSTAFLMVGVALVMFLMAGADIKQVGALLGASLGAALIFGLSSEYRRQRLFSYFTDKDSPIEHLIRTAGIFGQGFDRLQSEAERIPGAYNDYIFAFVVYGFGVVAALLLVAAFLFVGYRAVRIARRAPNGWGMLISIGIGSWILLQGFAHMAVNADLVPITGMTLPFISYGGSSLVACMAGVGVLLSISEDNSRETERSAVYSYGGRDRRPRLSRSNRRSSSSRKSARR